MDAVFFDRRDDPRNVRNHSYLTYSIDDGRSFVTNLRISGDPSDTRIGQKYTHPAARGQYEIGARLGLLSFEDRAVAAWPDTRHWTPGATGQDLFSVSVAFPPLTPQRRVFRLVGAWALVAGLAGLAGLVVARRRGTSVMRR